MNNYILAASPFGAMKESMPVEFCRQPNRFKSVTQGTRTIGITQNEDH
jgi:hypothetical protein